MGECKSGPDLSVIVLQVFSLPIMLILGAIRLLRTLRGYRSAAEGRMECPHCGFSNPMNVLATCPECGTTEFGSRLYCTGCRAVSPSFDCGECRATIRVFPS